MKSIHHIQNERILFSPLNWGMGHVSRSIPLLQKLCEQNNTIVIACNQEQQVVYSEYLPDVDYINWPGYPFRFNGNGNFGTDLFLSLWNLYQYGKEERSFMKLVAKNEKISLIISDHRYFFRSDEVKSIFVTHQLNLPLPWYLKVVQKVHRTLINRFNEIWVVDDENTTFSGELSEKSKNDKRNVFFLGPLSRFMNEPVPNNQKWTTILVSGPEPYAKQFYSEQRKRFTDIPKNYCIIYNGNCETSNEKKGISWKEIDERLKETKTLIARSGYSTIMDAHFLACETEWHPTPGQLEQEYLATFHK